MAGRLLERNHDLIRKTALSAFGRDLFFLLFFFFRFFSPFLLSYYLFFVGCEVGSVKRYLFHCLKGKERGRSRARQRHDA